MIKQILKYKIRIGIGAVVVGIGATAFFMQPTTSSKKPANSSSTTTQASTSTAPSSTSLNTLDQQTSTTATDPQPVPPETPPASVQDQVKAQFALSFPASQTDAEWTCFSNIINDLHAKSPNFQDWDLGQVMDIVNYVKSISLKSYCGQDRGLLFERIAVGKFCTNNDVTQCVW